MNITEMQKKIEQKVQASSIDKIGIASLLFMTDSLFFELMEEFKDKKNLDGNKVIYKIIKLFGGMTIQVPPVYICNIYEYFCHKSNEIQALTTIETHREFIMTMREVLKLNNDLSEGYLLAILKKYRNIITREHITDVFTEQKEGEAAWIKSIAKLKKIKNLK